MSKSKLQTPYIKDQLKYKLKDKSHLSILTKLNIIQAVTKSADERFFILNPDETESGVKEIIILAKNETWLDFMQLSSYGSHAFIPLEIIEYLGDNNKGLTRILFQGFHERLVETLKQVGRWQMMSEEQKYRFVLSQSLGNDLLNNEVEDLQDTVQTMKKIAFQVK